MDPDPDLDPDPGSDPYPAFFVIDLQDANKQKLGLNIFFCLLLFEGKFTVPRRLYFPALQ